MYLSTDAKFQQVTSQTCEFPYISRDVESETCHRPEISLLAERESESSLDTSASDDSDDIGIIENCPTGNEAEPSDEAKGLEKSLSMENIECFTEVAGSAASNLPLTTVARSSQDSDTMSGSNKNGVHHFCQETPTTPLHQISDAVDDKVSFDDVQTVNLETPDLCDEQAAKRRRIVPLDGESDYVGMLTQESLL